MNILTRAQEVAKKLNLKESSHGYSFYFQDEISNDDLIELIENDFAVCSYDSELFVFNDSSCINRMGDEYFINDDVDLLDNDYLSSVGYL